MLRNTSTTLLPTPPVAPVTNVIPEESIDLTGLLGDGPVSFSIRDSKNFKKKKKWLGVMKCHKKSHMPERKKKGQPLPGKEDH